MQKLFKVICPCKNKIYLTKEELFGEQYIFCYSCSQSFKNLNYVEVENGKSMFKSR